MKSALSLLLMIAFSFAVHPQSDSKPMEVLDPNVRALSSPITYIVKANPRSMDLGSVSIPGDLTSTRIVVSLTNDHTATITEMEIHPFNADGGKGLVIEWAARTFDDLGPIIEYPCFGLPGRGPVVARFTDFDPGETFLVLLDPDSYDDENYGVPISGMEFTEVIVAYSDGTRGRAVLRVTNGELTGIVSRSDN
jgi:hypothetical protein